MTTASIEVNFEQTALKEKYHVAIGDIECLVIRRYDYKKRLETWEVQEITQSSLSLTVKEMLIKTVRDKVAPIEALS
jgi:hypothetical protein